ncbi:hypothetical protein [Ferruginibacter albus]|uniref:hypothetical protein n=1 Tax=Ferruginibacter albus TaxID=2875540 RepID=UPI001CC4CDA6|nr:hypothetical protein [Ferruginibacter albus]UAY53351.1 hypothetical protein K9M53_06685 [Ferruginibacter albus]
MTKSLSSLLLLSAIILFSCSKSNTDGGHTNIGGTLKATIDGTPTTFYNAVATKVTTTSGNYTSYSIGIGAWEGIAYASSGITLAVAGTESIKANTYYSNYATFGNAIAGLNYFKTGSVNFASNEFTPDTCILTINSLTQDSVKGTFSGRVKLLTGNASDTVHVITNGSFSAVIAN